jgi:hypothetical protein
MRLREQRDDGSSGDLFDRVRVAPGHHASEFRAQGEHALRFAPVHH